MYNLESFAKEIDKSKSHVGGYLQNGEQPIEIIKYIVEKCKPNSVLDVGCGPVRIN